MRDRAAPMRAKLKAISEWVWEKKWRILLVAIILGVWAAAYIGMREQLAFWWVPLRRLGYQEHGTVGDAFGPLTALFAMLAFVLSVFSSKDQGEELKRTIRVQALTAAAAQTQSTAMELGVLMGFLNTARQALRGLARQADLLEQGEYFDAVRRGQTTPDVDTCLCSDLRLSQAAGDIQDWIASAEASVSEAMYFRRKGDLDSSNAVIADARSHLMSAAELVPAFEEEIRRWHEAKAEQIDGLTRS